MDEPLTHEQKTDMIIAGLVILGALAAFVGVRTNPWVGFLPAGIGVFSVLLGCAMYQVRQERKGKKVWWSND